MKIPDKLDVIMHRLTREVLFQQPKNIYEFAADLMDKLIEERDGGVPFYIYNALVILTIIIFIVTLIKGEIPSVALTDENAEMHPADINDDDADKELQQLADDDGRLDGEASSPPPTMDESMSERGSSPVIPMVVTLKPHQNGESVDHHEVSLILFFLLNFSNLN